MQREINWTINLKAILDPCTTAYLEHKHQLASPSSGPPPGAPSSSSVGGESLLVFTVDAIDMQGMCIPLLLTRFNIPVGYYPKKEFQALDAIPNVSLLRQGFVGCTPVQPRLAVATNVFEFYTAARGVHPGFSIEAFTRTLWLVYKVS